MLWFIQRDGSFFAKTLEPVSLVSTREKKFRYGKGFRIHASRGLKI